MQDHPGAPGTARQESTRTIVSTNDGGVATQQRAPGHERPHAASSGAARHGRLSAATRAPGADIPRAPSARAPGQYCQSAAPRAPGHGRPLAITAGAPCHDRLSAAPRAPGVDAAPAIAATVPNHHRPSAAPIATVALPAGLRRLRQVILPRTPATPNTLTNLRTHQDTASSLQLAPQSRPMPANPVGAQHVAPVPPQGGGTTGGLNGSPSQPAAGHHVAPSPGACSGGGLGRGRLSAHPTTHQVHPAIQVPPCPRSCSTAAMGFLLRPHSRAPARGSPPKKPALVSPGPFPIAER